MNSTNHSLLFVSLLTLAVLFLTGCGGGGDSDTAAREASDTDVQIVEVTVGMLGYEPSAIEVEAGTPVRLVFTRVVESHCLEQVQAPDFGVAPVDLPMNQPVAIEFTPERAGTYGFACGMDMVRGSILVSS